MEFEQAPRENLETWNILKKMITVSSIGIAIVLGLMAATLT